MIAIGVVLEGIFQIPASKVLNVSVLNSNLIEVVITNLHLSNLKNAVDEIKFHSIGKG